ncbi:hypothetical protein MYSTI_07383 [Myxococcus stipitatus DSM 14675]|uniref:DUF5723 domain-containing protein n=1 Tax=Myxococcus stipitatus (strain DSM 14675 / JCM 12634 / Mx s8) TaxID=1278073 RepID=L7UL72_MYXSD|nr:hypothetical protein [Myxococcus stipitatus]AGC48655.1 hypothetical protein MYSTI_07383 [Myxococcus stipitatus DSM 14675]
MSASDAAPVSPLRDVPWLRLLTVGIALGLASPAWAQEGEPIQPRPERLYFNPGALLGSARVVSLGGAYVGIAEGAAGFPSNLAALAHRGPALDKDWDLGVTLSWLDLPFTSGRARDVDNDGRADEGQDRRQLLGGLMLQYKRFGIGFALRNSVVAYCATATCAGDTERIRVSLTQSVLAGAVSFGQDDFILALGIYAAQASFRLSSGGDDWRYGDTGVAIDMLYRPHGRPWRLGVTVRPEVIADWRRDGEQPPVLAGRTLFGAVVSPAVLSLGASWRLGEGAERYNRLSPASRRQLIIDGDALPVPEEEPRDAPAGRWLISAQVDLLSSVDNAVPLRSFASTADEEFVGHTTTFAPRLGVEHDTVPGMIRLRAGVYAEPSPFDGRPPRPHITGGFEVFVLRYWEDWSISASFDLASRYSNVGLSIGFWR